MTAAKPPRRNDNRIIIHFDYDCFYASVFENENPALKSVPLAVQQKQIIVTCNYEARRRGLYKLELIADAKRKCPDVVIVLGEELGRFRDASKLLYKFLVSFTWSGKVERLGFDEVFMDVSDIVDFNQALLNPNDLAHSFFQLKKDDPTAGFSFDATTIAGHQFPAVSNTSPSAIVANGTESSLMTRLLLGSHLAQHLRWSLEEQKGYTSTVGISTNKLLSKLVGNMNKPKGQTTLVPPYVALEEAPNSYSNVTTFVDSHDIGKIPGIGFKMSQSIRNHVLSRPADFDTGLIYGGTKEAVTVHDVRNYPGMGPEVLEKILGGPGSERGIGGKAWGLINGVDETEVQQMKRVPAQISIEDSYIRMETMAQAIKELRILATSLVKRMHTDLLDDDEDATPGPSKRWIALPKTIRISTRLRPPANAEGTRARSFRRISRSGPLPSSVFNLHDNVEAVVEKLVMETLVPMFRRLHPYPTWSLSLINVGVTNMMETASEGPGGGGRDISRMFRRQEEVLKEWKVEDRDVPPDPVPDMVHEEPTLKSGVVTPDNIPAALHHELKVEDRAMPSNLDMETSYTVRKVVDQTISLDTNIHPTSPPRDHDTGRTDPSAGKDVHEGLVSASEDSMPSTQDAWEEEEEEDERREMCGACGAWMPVFALTAHERFHVLKG